ncbi:serine dehydratase subunit alpha family protein [Murimonas intestini]|uniref:UPF0597 protein C7383_11534 n=1 Tax=Murimonas intestini TaxID=1337051 RepID=A0AB73SZK1_9FIRM|nr:L-serine ammonia-lyase, iron-sulfur-dependent, subunit alpha [Murimonas intestini]MCR1842807.1 L-serine ammonia-lyase, iron-sulfur-dependent, subunit alpha [Murimonas intestini]MCR1867854.1 L-serine ammonia-lyase, iron-sulfur-dependent, subunit alpha [Murimonas intestini]MCR1885205.1 L-serine ammonia-lyase, iron-sulfur-dependent, subunit alpha [Murimonas intestini]
MDSIAYQNCLRILRKELVPALGCTEPIAVAYAAARTREVLGSMPQRVRISCSSNIIKNVKGVEVPNSGGLKGIESAAALGIAGGDSKMELELLDGIGIEAREAAKKILNAEIITCELACTEENLYIAVEAEAEENSAEVVIAGGHTHVVRIKKNGETVFEDEEGQEEMQNTGGASSLNLDDIFRFAKEVKQEDIRGLLDAQIACNQSVAIEGIKKKYGAGVGRVIMENFGDDVRNRVVAFAAAGSDARMGGCPMPVVINSGSGNQGLTVSVPIIEYADQMGTDKETLYRALALGNLIAIYQKSFIGRLSAFCGAVSAAAGAVSGIGWIEGDSREVIEKAVANTICTIGGMVCDGAKASCASKIAIALEAGLLSLEMAKQGIFFAPGDGLMKDGTEETIKCIGRMAREGMTSTDEKILQIMLEHS